MKTFFGLIFLLIVVAAFLALGNMLRCASVSKQSECPELCHNIGTQKAELVVDDNETAEEYVKCQAPSLPDYWQYFGEWVQSLRYKK